ncbi:BamA/TamA family outer membrane protein [Corallococcus sp. M34]|nr:BamA/TamA family outer membrane protein [Citreicoccus inhibens]
MALAWACAVGPWQARAEDAPEVVSVELHLPGGTDAEGLSSLVAVRKGQALSPSAVRRSVERLWATGRFSDVVARKEDVPGGVRLVFLLTPLLRLSTVSVHGNQVLTTAEVLEASNLLEGGPLDPEELESAVGAVQEAYRARGYDAVKVDASQAPVPGGGVAVTLRLEEGLPTRVRQVTFLGASDLPLPRLMDTLGMRPGDVFDRGRLEAGLERLRVFLREDHRWRARVGVPTVTVEEGGAAVAVPLSAGPRFTMRFRGNHRMPDVLLARVAAYEGEDTLDDVVEARLARKLEAFYRQRGFHSARVRAHSVERADGAVAALTFDVEEGHPLRVTEVRFHGNTAVSSQDLRAQLTARVAAGETRPELDLPLRDDPLAMEGRHPPDIQGVEPPPDPSTVYVEEAWLDAADGMTTAYREQGFSSALVTFRGLTMDTVQHTAVADFDVEEGPRALVRDVRFEGMPADVHSEWTRAMLRRGAPLSFERVEQVRAATERGLGHEGYLFAHVANKVTVDGEGKAASVVFEVDAGPRVHVGKVLIQGLTRTDPDVVLAYLDLKEGAPLSMEDLADGQRRLARLGLFKQAEVSLADPNRREGSKDVLVSVQERARLDGEVSGGYFLVDGPRVTLDTAWRNVDGKGLNVLARGKVNYAGWSAQALGSDRRPAGCDSGLAQGSACDSDLDGLSGLGGRGNLALSQSRLYFLSPQEVGARLDLIGERVHRPSYLSTRFAAVAGLDWAVSSWLNLSLQYEVENNRLRSRAGVLELVNRADQERLRYPFGDFALHSLRPAATLDFRDDPANPRRGMVLTTSAEFMRGLSVRPTDVAGDRVPAFPINSVKLAGNLSVYAPLGRRASVALSARAGTIVPLTEGAQNIGSKLFYLGGSSSLRGFREDGVLPQDVRQALHQRLSDCRSLITPSGCSEDLKAVLAGQFPTSQGGELYTLGKAELRVPALAALDLGLFIEAGNLWQDRTLFDPTELRYSAGVGLRYVTPVGPLAFDVGFNLDRDEAVNEAPTQFHFSIGAF